MDFSTYWYQTMKNIIKNIKSMRLGKNTIWLVLMLLVGAGLFSLIAFVLKPFESMSRFPSAMLIMYIGIMCLMYMDKIHHHDIDTTQAINNNNIAYALIMVAYALIISAVILIV